MSAIKYPTSNLESAQEPDTPYQVEANPSSSIHSNHKEVFCTDSYDVILKKMKIEKLSRNDSGENPSETADQYNYDRYLHPELQVSNPNEAGYEQENAEKFRTLKEKNVYSTTKNEIENVVKVTLDKENRLSFGNGRKCRTLDKEILGINNIEKKLSKLKAKIMRKKSQKVDIPERRNSLEEITKESEEKNSVLTKRPLKSRSVGRTPTFDGPHLHVDSRAEYRCEQHKVYKEPEEVHFKARPMPENKPFEVKRPGKHTIEYKLFHLHTEERGAMKEKALQEEIKRQQELEKSMRQFKASGLPEYDKLARIGVNTHFEPLKLTIPQEIKLRTSERALLHPEIHTPESFYGHENHHFKATAPPDFSHPFVPETGKSRLTEIEEFKLHTERRSLDRAEFDKYLRRREFLRDFRKKQLEEEMKRREELEIKELRKRLVFVAQPIRYYSPITIQPCRKPLAIPTSPKLGPMGQEKIEELLSNYSDD